MNEVFISFENKMMFILKWKKLWKHPSNNLYPPSKTHNKKRSPRRLPAMLYKRVDSGTKGYTKVSSDGFNS